MRAFRHVNESNKKNLNLNCGSICINNKLILITFKNRLRKIFLIQIEVIKLINSREQFLCTHTHICPHIGSEHYPTTKAAKLLLQTFPLNGRMYVGKEEKVFVIIIEMISTDERMNTRNEN
jgi:hypothetical protein